MGDRPVVVQHSFGTVGTGGPIGALERILSSDLVDRYEFIRMHHDRATGGIDIPRISAWTRLLRETKPDLVHVRGLGNEGFHGVLAARLAGCPRILLSVHGTIRDLVGKRTLKQHALINVIEPWTMSMATHVTTVCRFAAERDFARKHRDKFVGPITNGVLPLGRASLAQRTAVRRELGVGDGDVVIMSVGRLVHDKGHRDLAASLSMLSRRERDAIVVVPVGDGPNAEEIRQAYVATGVRNRFLGKRLDVASLLAGADIFAFPSLQENLPNALLEAMSRALPVIATRVGGIPEILNEGGGVLIDAGDQQALARSLSLLMADSELAMKMGADAFEVVKRRYSVEQMCAALDQTYQRIIASSPA